VEAALNHYHDKISPMVGVALILNPSMKKDFLGWKKEWVNMTMEHFSSAFNHYKEKNEVSLDCQIPALREHETEYAEYMKTVNQMCWIQLKVNL